MMKSVNHHFEMFNYR